MNTKPINVNYPVNSEVNELSEDMIKDIESLSNDMFTDASTARSIKNIKKTLATSVKKYNKDWSKEDIKTRVDEILKIHGLSESNFDFMKSFEKFTSEKLNDTSIDDNSNKNETTVGSLLAETTKSVNKVLGYDYLYRTMKELYGKKEAKRLSGEMYDFSLGLSDSSNILIPYCWAGDFSKLVTSGREFGVLHSKPAKRVNSYVSMLNETIHQMSHHLAGAIAVGTFFLDIAHLSIYKERISLEDLKHNKETRKYFENSFQHFIHSVNHLTRSGGSESPFTNVSVFDRDKLVGLVSEDNYGWYFPKRQGVFNDNCKDILNADENYTKENHQEFILDYIEELQKIFINFFDKGDPTKNGMNYRFPVVTVNLSKYADEEGKLNVRDDNELLKFIVTKDISKYNIFNSEGTKVSSCCRMINSEEMMDMASSVNSFGGSSISMGSHRVVTTNFARLSLLSDNKEEYFKLLEQRVSDSAKILKAHKILLYKLTGMKLNSFIDNGFINLNRMFSTFGVIGVVEADEIAKQKGFVSNDEDFQGEILIRFEELTKKYSREFEIISNIEQIPAESFAVRLVNTDRLIFGDTNLPYKLYANQFVPLWKDASIFEKLEADGKYNQLLSGGGIVHIQCNENLTSKQATKLINKACSVGCEHFAINCVYSHCKSCGYVEKSRNEKCSKCEGQNEFLTRVVGFFTPIDSWNKTRRDWEFENRNFTTLKDV
jgi:ribonucleoside-triphosphate reductase